MPTFPTLSKPPSFPLKESREDTTIKSTSEDGIVKTRTRYTKRRRTWEFRYESISSADIALVEAFIETVHGCTDTFTWTHPVSGEYTTRFSKIPDITLTSYDGSTYLYETDIALLEY